MFEFIPTPIEGCFEIQPKIIADHRGTFRKVFHSTSFLNKGLAHSFEDVHYWVLTKDAIRGLHFQPIPYASALLVTCVSGCVLDVVVDLRSSSDTYKRVFSRNLEASRGNMLYIPEGLAHGCLSTVNKSIIITMSSKENMAVHKAGLNWASIDFDWPVDRPIVSPEDQALVPLTDYQTQF